jgi:dTDP-glucose 4,6-dehydratase
MKLLVTGGAGFIGSHYVRQALSGAYPGLVDADVIVLDALTYAGSRTNLAPVAESPRLRFVHGDICNVDLVDGLVGEADQVVHFAAESHVDRSIVGAADFVRTNVLGTQTLLDAAHRHGVERFVHVSTDEVYGSIESGSWPETFPLQPNSPYAASKASSDLIALAYARTHNVPVTVTRCSNNYGPYQFPEKVIPLFVTLALDDDPLPLYASTENRREWIHVLDHCRAIALVIERGRVGETYHVGTGVERSIEEIANAVLDELGKPSTLKTIVPDRPGHDRRYALDWNKIRGELGWEPTVDFGPGLAETVQWYAANRAWWKPLRERAPVREDAAWA